MTSTIVETGYRFATRRLFQLLDGIDRSLTSKAKYQQRFLSLFDACQGILQYETEHPRPIVDLLLRTGDVGNK